MGSSTPCPDLREFQGLLSGQASVADKESLLGHLETCEACAKKVLALPAQDTLIEWIRQAKALPGSPEEKQLTPLIQRLIQLRQPAGSSSVSDSAIASRVPLPSDMLTFTCAGCGKRLRIKEEAVGKKVKCPHCGQVGQVPLAGKQNVSVQTSTPAGGETVAVPPEQANPSAAEASAGGRTTLPEGQREARDNNLYSFLAPSQGPDEQGRLGHYRILKVLGAGGMGVVFRAEDTQLKRVVALKAMLPTLAANDAARQRFLREARAAASLKHDNVIHIYQVGEDRGVPFLAMEYLEGESLEDRLNREGKLSLPEVLRIGRELTEGLEAAHEHGLIHRDIKPGNVWLEGRRGRVKILDFGLARTSKDDLHLTQSGAIVGTSAYMPPEQARGEKVDARCDLYSLGCVLYRLCTEELPFQADNMMSLMMALATEEPRSPRQLNADVPPALAELIVRLLAKDPAKRPASARAVAEALDAIPATAAPSQQPPAPPRRRRVIPLALAAGFVLAALLTVVVIYTGGGRELVRVIASKGAKPAQAKVDREPAEPVIGRPPQENPKPPQGKTSEEPLQVIDLIEVFQDSDRVAVKGFTDRNQWTKAGGKLTYTSDGHSGKIMVPVSLNDVRDYEIDARVRRLSGDSVFTFDLFCSLTHQTGLDIVIGGRIELGLKGGQRVAIGAWPASVGDSGHIVVRVRYGADGHQGSVVVTVDGKEAAKWNGDWTEIGKPSEFRPDFRGERIPTIFCFKDSFEFSSWQLKIYEGRAQIRTTGS
jgi:serine/threonine protein kinase/phage FluMu protein Com